ncbi:MAG: recombinase family protein [Planctomycetes bacterium]|nr:recombinase family protein [Planctomycetota bacterium]
MTKKAFSYARFSTSEQADGRSLRRQEEAAQAYCSRHGLTLDERSFADLGVSGYHGSNATHGQLGDFLELVKDKRVPTGSVLIVENIDRLSRLPPDEATALIMQLVNAGVDVVTVSPEQRYSKSNIHSTGVWVPLQVAICLAAEESRKKGERLADAWSDKRDTVRTVKLSKKGPAWLKLTADRSSWLILEDKAAAVRRIFALAIDGNGVSKIAGILHTEYPDGLTGKGWQPGFIRDILRSRSVIGEYHPHVGTCAKKGRKSTRKPFGEPIKGYFPAIIDDETFYRAQTALNGRKAGGGRTTGTPNLFNGLLYDATDGRRLTINTTHGKKVLVSSGAVRKIKGSTFRSIGYDMFETAILSALAELKPADVLGKPNGVQDRIAALAGKLTAVNRNRDAVKAKAATADDVSVFFALLTDLDKQSKTLAEELELAKAEAANQQSDNLGELTSLSALLRDAEDEDRDLLRKKTRAALRRLVSEMRVLIVPRGAERLIAVRVYLATGIDRDYLIRTWSASRCREGGWQCRSVLVADAAPLGLAVDLRDPDERNCLASYLTALRDETLKSIVFHGYPVHPLPNGNGGHGE